MFAKLKRYWAEVQRLEPGERFQTLYERHQKNSAGRSFLARAAAPIAAVVSLAIGVILVFIPGPAVLFFAMAAALLSIQSRTVARGCDYGEVRLRRLVAAMKRWKQRHFPKRSQRVT